ncbi:MAG: tetratricopeptide repeat protein [Armatimonadota bacterium]
MEDKSSLYDMFLKAEKLWKKRKSEDEKESVVKAVKILNRILKEDPDHVLSLILMGGILEFSKGCFQELGLSDEAQAYTKALEYCDRALEIDPLSAEAWACKSEILLLRIGQPAQALDAVKKGMQAFVGGSPSPEDDPKLRLWVGETLYSNKVWALAALGREDEARETLAEGFRHYPGSKFLQETEERFLPAGN